MSLSSVIRYIVALDTSSTTGAGKTGLAFGDITAKYLVKGGTLVSLTTETITTLGTYQAPTSNAHIRIKELNSADPTKGVYEVHFHNDQVAATGEKLWLFLSATGALFERYEQPLEDIPGRVPSALTGDGNIKADTLRVSGTTQTAGDLYGYLTTNLGALGANLSAIPKTGFKLASDGIAAVTAWTVAITGNITGNLSGSVGSVPDSSGITTLLTRIATTLNVANVNTLASHDPGSTLASSSEVTGLNVNTRSDLIVPIEIELPDASTQVYKIRLYLYDIVGNMEAPDSTPTVALVNAAGTDRSSRVSVASNPSTGVYSWDYTATVGDAEEQLNWTFTVVEGGLTRVYAAASYVVEESAFRFSSTDRANLVAVLADTNELQTDLTNGGRLDLLFDDMATAGQLLAATSGLATASSITTLQNLIGLGGTGLNDIPWNADWDAQVQSEVQDALEAMHLHRLFGSAYDPANKPGNAAGLLNVIFENDSGVPRYTVNALEQAPSGGGGGGSDPWETALPGTYTAGQAGYIVGNYLNMSISSLVGLVGSVSNSVIPNGGILTLRKGDDYFNADGRRKTFTATVPGAWGGGSAADCKLRLRSGVEVVEIVCVAISQTGSTLSMGFDIAATDFADLPPGKPKIGVRDWQIVVDPGTDHNLTPIYGVLTLDDSIPEPA